MCAGHREDQPGTPHLIIRDAVGASGRHLEPTFAESALSRWVDRIAVLLGRDTGAHHIELQAAGAQSITQHHLAHGGAADVSGAYDEDLWQRIESMGEAHVDDSLVRRLHTFGGSMTEPATARMPAG